MTNTYVTEKHTDHATHAFRVRNLATGETHGWGLTQPDAYKLAEWLAGGPPVGH